MRKGRAVKRVSRAKAKVSPKKKAKRPEVFRAAPPVYVERSVSSSFSETLPSDLPFSYGETKLALLVRDPYWAYSYWDFSGETWNWAQAKLAGDPSLKPFIRVHDLDAKRSYSLIVSMEAKNWYLHLGTPDHRYFTELGIGDGNSRFYLIARSNEVRTPRDSPSHVIDPEWNDRDFDEIYRLSGGGQPGLSSPGSLFFPRHSS